MPKATSKAQAGRQLSDTLNSKKNPVEVSQNKHTDFMTLKSEVNAYQAGNIKKLLQSLVRNNYRL